MFPCGVCGQVTKPGEKATRLTVETRQATYPYREDAHKYMDLEGKEIIKDDPGGTGNEIVKEVLVCPPCSTTQLIIQTQTKEQ